MNLIKKNVSVFTERMSFDVFNDMSRLFSVYGRAKNCIYARFSSISSYLSIYNYKKEIRDVLTEEGFLEMFPIPKRYVRMAMDEAVSNIKTRWVQITEGTKKSIAENKNLTDEEKHYLYYALKAKKCLFDILNRIDEDCVASDKFDGIDRKKMNNMLRRYVRRNMPRRPVTKKCRSMMIDVEMWREEDGFFYISGLNEGKREKLGLNTKIKLTGNLRTLLDRDRRRLKISNVIETNTHPFEEYGPNVGIDKNYINAIDTSSENRYGVGLNAEQGRYTEVMTAKNKKRNYYHALVKKCEEKGNYQKAQKITKFNLGKKKYNKTKNRLTEEIRKKINSEIKRFLVAERPKKVPCENLNFSVSKKQKKKQGKIFYSRKTNNKLSGFVKGIIQERLDYKASIYEVETPRVNAACTSQACNICDGEGHRKDDMFHCHSCGKVEHSGYVAAKVVLARLDDKEITLRTPPYQVKAILKKRLSERKMEIKSQLLHRANPDLGQEEIPGKERIIQETVKNLSFG